MAKSGKQHWDEIKAAIKDELRYAIGNVRNEVVERGWFDRKLTPNVWEVEGAREMDGGGLGQDIAGDGDGIHCSASYEEIFGHSKPQEAGVYAALDRIDRSDNANHGLYDGPQPGDEAESEFPSSRADGLDIDR